MFSLSSFLESRIVYCICGQCLNDNESRRKFNKLRLDALSIQNYVIMKGPIHGARHGKTEVQREYHLAWNVWKRCCKKVDSQGGDFTGFTIDFSEIQWIVNHSSQIGWTEKECKEWDELACKRRPYISSHSRGREKIPRTQAKKMGLWNFDLILEPLSWWKIVYTTNQENNEERLYQDQQRRWHSSSSTSWWDKSEWNWKWAHKIFNCSNLFLLQLVSFTVDSDPLTDGEVRTDTPHTRLFLKHIGFVHASH